MMGQVVDSLPHYQQQLTVASYPQNAFLLKKIGEIYASLGEYDTAVATYHQWIAIENEQKNEIKYIEALQALGLVIRQQRNYPQAERYFRETRHLCEKLLAQNPDEKQRQQIVTFLANSYNYIGVIFYSQEKNDSALWYMTEAYQLRKSIGDEVAVSKSLNNIGLIYRRRKEYDKALHYFSQTIDILSKKNDSTALVPVYDNIGRTYMFLKDYSKALSYIQKGLEIAEKHHLLSRMEESYATMAELYVTKKDFEKAYFYKSKVEVVKDSLYNRENAEKIAKMQALYETDRHKKQADLYRSEKALLETNAEKRKLVIYFSLLALVLALLAVGVFYSRFRLKNKANKDLQLINAELNQQKEETEAQKELIERQNLTLNTALQQIEKQNIDIKSSINYAKRIQTAMLPPVEEIQKYFPDTFILLRPKDVVSGDFYYFTPLEDEQYIFAAVDCTGHGVPGAFMSLIGNTLLDEIVHILNYTQPNEILKELDKRVRRLLKQQESTQKDGMDLTICHINKQTATLQCAGAMNPLLVIKDNEVEYIKGNRHAIGGFLDIKNAKQFDNQSIVINDYQNVIVYMFSDGFQDQFGGKPVKKFMQKNFKELLVKISVLPFAEQKQVLNSTLENWMAEGNETQIDDVLVMGIRIR